jgi:hypothetical protein
VLDNWGDTGVNNSYRPVRLFAPLATISLALVACGGGGSDSGNTSLAPANASPGGIWTGIDSFTNLQLIGLVTETGEFHFLRSDNLQTFGTVSVSGNNVSGNLTGATPVGTSFPDGSTTGTGTFSGTVQARSSLTGTVTFRTAGGTSTTSNISLTFNPIYNRPSSLATIAGNYRDPSTNAVISVTSNGAVFEQDAVTGCVINGTISIINATYNAYGVQYTFASCRGSYTILNGTTANGIGTLDNTVSPEVAIIAVVNATAGYALTEKFQRT